MKKVIFAGALVIASFSLKAQHVQFGIKGGLNISNIKDKDGEPNNAYDTRFGAFGGGLAHIHLAKHWAIQPEVVYSQQGTKFNSGPTEITRNLNYINVPVLAQYMTASGFRLEAGPQIGFLVSAKDEANNVKTDVKDRVKSTEMAMVFGLGYITKSGFGVDARLNAGLTDIRKDSPIPGKSKNDVVQVGVFYQFGSSK